MKRPLTILIPSYNDERILGAIDSVRAFDDADGVRLLIVDGASDPDLVKKMEDVLEPDDVLISESDEGIFDALNKGLGAVVTPYLGWLGADDLFTGVVSSSEVIDELSRVELFMWSVAFIRGNQISRVTSPRPSAQGFSSLGLHNPHYGTFAHTRLVNSFAFDTSHIAADIPYFLDVFDARPSINWTKRIGTLQREGGFSNRSASRLLETNREVFGVYRKRSNALAAAAGITAKLAYKAGSRTWYIAKPVNWRTRFPMVSKRVPG